MFAPQLKDEQQKKPYRNAQEQPGKEVNEQEEVLKKLQIMEEKLNAERESEPTS